jgi:hypothetical protein
MTEFKQRAVTTAITTPNETLIRMGSSSEKMRVKVMPTKAENPATTPSRMFTRDFASFMAFSLPRKVPALKTDKMQRLVHLVISGGQNWFFAFRIIFATYWPIRVKVTTP